MIFCANCVTYMRGLPDASIDMVLTSPPYDDIRNYHGFSFDAQSVFEQLYRVIRPGRAVVWNVADATRNGGETGTSMRQALMAMDVGFTLSDTMIYAKRNPVPTNRQIRRYHQAWEYLFVLTRGPLECFNPIMRPTSQRGLANMRFRGTDGHIGYHQTPRNAETKVRNIFEYTIGGGHSSPDDLAHDHPAIMPYELARDMIRSYSDPGDLIYDPFAGSGTSLLAARDLKRRYLGTDISENYCDLARVRLSQDQIRSDIWHDLFETADDR